MLILLWLGCSEPEDGCGADTTSICETENCEDCDVVGNHSDLGADECVACDGAACADETPPAGCEGLTCIEGEVVVRACDCDADCDDLGLLCGLHATAFQGICTAQDDF